MDTSERIINAAVENHEEEELQILSDYVIDGENHEFNDISVIITLPPIFLADPSFTFAEPTPQFTLEQQRKLTIVCSASRRISWLSIVDCILVSFILYFAIYYLIFVVIFMPIIGFIGSRKYSMKLCIIYSGYLVVVVLLRIYLLYYMPAIAIIIIQGLICMLELYIFAIDIKFIRQLKTLDEREKSFLQGLLPPPQEEEHIPSSVEVKILESPPNVYQL